MNADNRCFPQGEIEFNKWLIKEYFKYGSVDEVFRIHKFNIPISYAQYQRILDRWGIIKAAGPNNKLNETINFFYKMVEDKMPLDKLYRKMPPSFKTSAVTLYRILNYVREGITRRTGTALILTPYGNDKKVLIGKDVSTPRLELGKQFGALTIPMGFSRIGDLRVNAVKRILQMEVFTDLVVDGKIPSIIPDVLKPIIYLDIADVRVEVFHIRLNKKVSGLKYFSSYKLNEFRYVSLDNLKKLKRETFRSGVIEALGAYKKFLDLKERNLSFNPLQVQSDINYRLVEVKEVN